MPKDGIFVVLLNLNSSLYNTENIIMLIIAQFYKNVKHSATFILHVPVDSPKFYALTF